MCRETVAELVLPVVLDPDQWGAGTGRGGRDGGDPPARAWDSHLLHCLVLLLQLLCLALGHGCQYTTQHNPTRMARFLGPWGLLTAPLLRQPDIQA